MSAEKHQLIAFFAALAIFIRMAKRAPMHHKMYKELAYSMGIGSAIGSMYPYYYWRKYINVVDESYEFVKVKFAENPELLRNNDDHDKSISVNKNFGLSQFNANDIENDEDFTEEEYDSKNIMTGSVEEYAKKQKTEVLAFLYG